VTGASNGAVEFALNRDAALTWVERWETQQQVYMPDREERFTAILDAVEEVAGRPDPLILDLGSGPGSLAIRLIRRMPSATVVALDADPLLLELGRSAWRDVSGLRFADADFRTADWSAALGLERRPDAAVSTTALHWLTQSALIALYAELGRLLRPGGLFLNGDHLRGGDDAPVLMRLGRTLIEREEHRRFPGGHTESWGGWWTAAADTPELAPLYAERQARQVESEHHGSPAYRLSVHCDALRAAGFAEVGTLWQRGENRLLCGVLAG
jgi:SAM-dependent methyltransferase